MKFYLISCIRKKEDNEWKEHQKKQTSSKKNVRRDYKARLFAMVFQEKEELLELYNAVNQTDYKNPEELEINTLENAIYLSMQNDISFIIDSRLSLYEHQSTYSPNLPLRYLMYVADLYSRIVKDMNLYGSKKVEIPSPRFLIFYNGVEKRAEREELYLSDLYSVEEKEPWLELKAVLLNINPGYNQRLVKTCKTLRDYVEYTSRVRSYAEEMEIEEAVERAISECIREGVLSEFLKKYRAEAIKMSIYEYDEERQRRFDKEEGYELGCQAGRELGQELKLKELVQKKLQRGQSVEVIAEALEESVEVIQKIIEEISEE